jgi:cytochrome oxidase Cu insertion factor (SCO1/SenC/PrrC family)
MHRLALLALLLPLLLGTAPAAPFVPQLDVGATVPALPLIDESGAPFAFRGDRVTLVSFVYTRCRDATMCPLVSAKFARLQRAIDPRAVRLVEVTLDPSYDTPAVLRRYGAALGAAPDRWTFVTGAQSVVDELSARLGIVSRPDAPGTILHSEALVVLDPQARLVERVDGNRWSPEQALALAQSARGSANPVVRAVLWLSSGIAAVCGVGTSGVTVAGAIAIFFAVAAGIALAMRRAFRTL